MLAALAFNWLGTAFVCLWPGFDWGLRILAEAGITGRLAQTMVVGGALCDGVLGVGMLSARWRRPVLLAQLCLMAGYTVIVSLILRHYWFDPFAAVAKNLVLMVSTLWLFRTEPRR